MKKTGEKKTMNKLLHLVSFAGDEVLSELGHEGSASLNDQRILAADIDGHLVPGDIGRCQWHEAFSWCCDGDQFIVNKPRS